MVALAFLAPSLWAQGVSPSWEELRDPASPPVFKVAQYLELADAESPMVVVTAGRADGVVLGATFRAYRPSAPAVAEPGRGDPPLLVETGRLKAVEVQDHHTIARVEVQGSALAKAVFSKFSQIMAGDLVVPVSLKVARRPVVMPTLSLSYFDLFEDPKVGPATFELRPAGLEKLREAAQAFAAARVGVLMVEGYTDHHGPASANQIESYQRALTVRQYLIDELGFEAARVVAVGYGEAEPLDQSLAPGYVEANRRIVLKAIAAQPAR